MSQTIIIKPIVTEKSMQSTNPLKFNFMVAQSATKTELKKAVKDSFNVNVVSISTSKIKGKRKRMGTRRVEVSETPVKKATIMLKKGERISLFESGTDEEKKKKKKK